MQLLWNFVVYAGLVTLALGLLLFWVTIIVGVVAGLKNAWDRRVSR